MPKVDRFLEVSGYNRQLSGYPEILKKGVEMASNRYASSNPEIKKIIEKLVVKHFTVDLFKKSVRESLAAGISEIEMDRVLDFYKTDLALKMTELEVSATNAEMIEKIRTFDPETVSLEKRKEIDGIFDSIDFMENYMATQEAVMMGMFQVVNASVPVERRKNLDEISNMFRQRIRGQWSQYEILLKNNLYLIYASAEVEEIKKYRIFLQSSEAQKITALLFQGRQQALRKASQNFGRELIEEMNKAVKLKEGIRG